MNKVILHIGYPKTGTTWFQDNFYPNVENFYYIPIDNYRNQFILNPTFNKEDLKKLFENKDNVILCDEEFINIRKDQLFSVIPKRITTIFPNPTIIVFIRNQFSILESKYSQYIKCGGTMKINESINHLFRINKIKQWNYYYFLKPYFDLFGKNNIHIYLYEDYSFNFNVFIDFFINRYHFEISKFNPSKLNISYNKNIIKLARITNMFSKTQIGFYRPSEKNIMNIPYFHQASHLLYNKINKFLPQNKINLKASLDKQTYKNLYDYFSVGNKRLSKEFNLNLKKYNYPL